MCVHQHSICYFGYWCTVCHVFCESADVVYYLCLHVINDMTEVNNKLVLKNSMCVLVQREAMSFDLFHITFFRAVLSGNILPFALVIYFLVPVNLFLIF